MLTMKAPRDANGELEEMSATLDNLLQGEGIRDASQ